MQERGLVSAVPILRTDRVRHHDEANFQELLAHIAYIRQVEGLVEDGRMTPNTASQFFQQPLTAIEQINRTPQL